MTSKNTMSRTAAKLTIITAAKPSSLTKTFSLKLGGELVKTSGGSLLEGYAEIVEIHDLHSLSTLLQELTTNQAITYGVPAKSPIKIIPKKQYIESGSPDDSLPRTNETFGWPQGAGILMLDHDPVGGRDTYDQTSLLSLLIEVLPIMAATGSVWCPSASSHIYDGDKEIQGVKGQRLYLMVADAADIPRAGKVLIDRLWLAGYGFYQVSRSGRALERTTFDACVWQPNRLDFAAGAQCIPPLNQRRGHPLVTIGNILDTKSALPDLTASEQTKLKTIKRKAREAIADKIDSAKKRYIELRVKEDFTDTEESTVTAFRATIKGAVEHAVLCGDFPLTLDDGEHITVADVLDHPSRFQGRQCYDPLEPEYENNKVVGKLFLTGANQNLYSFAHGGCSYALIRQPRRIKYETGRQYEAREETLALMQEAPDLYDLGDELVTIRNGVTISMDRSKLQRWLGGRVQYYREKDQSKISVDVSLKDAIFLNELGKTRQLKPLKAVVTSCTCMADGRLITRPGYDQRSQLFLAMKQEPPAIPSTPSVYEIHRALVTVMEPFKSFPFASDLDRSVLLSAILTAVVRPGLRTSPAYGFDAPVQGSGKTLLAKSIAMLSTGEAASVWPHVSGNEEEIRKRLLSLLRDGSRAIVWDNVIGFFDSTSIAALITSEMMTDRLLGSSQHLTLPNSTLFLVTGNNLTAAGDMPRRMLKCRIDPRSEKPHARQFTIDPEAYIKQHRTEIVRAVLILLRGWFSSPDFQTNKKAPGRMASFEEWDDTVRQTVAWLSRHVDHSLVDPMEAINLANAEDPEQSALHDLLHAIHCEYKLRPFTAKELHQFAYRDCNGELHDALQDLAGKLPGTKSLGRYLTNREDRIVNGLSLRPLPPRNNTKRWSIQNSSETVQSC